MRTDVTGGSIVRFELSSKYHSSSGAVHTQPHSDATIGVVKEQQVFLTRFIAKVQGRVARQTHTREYASQPPEP